MKGWKRHDIYSQSELEMKGREKEMDRFFKYFPVPCFIFVFSGIVVITWTDGAAGKIDGRVVKFCNDKSDFRVTQDRVIGCKW